MLRNLFRRNPSTPQTGANTYQGVKPTTPKPPAPTREPKTWHIPMKEGIAPEEEENILPLCNYQAFCRNLFTVTMGRDANNQPVFLDLANSPHVLIAGTTGSGKSVGIKTILNALLLKNSPETMHLYIIDPKVVDYGEFKTIPHTKGYATSEQEAERLIKKLQGIMYNRLKAMSRYNAKHIDQLPEKDGFAHIVLVFDESASMSMKPFIKEFQDIACKSRAAGFHIILASQSPAARSGFDGLIKANCPARICYQTTNATESRVALDQRGAELLRGQGDAIIRHSNGYMERFQNVFINDNQINYIISKWACQM